MGEPPPTPTPEASPDLTALLQRYGSGDPTVVESIAREVYDRLRGMAHRRMRGQPADALLQSAALANEAFVRLFSGAPRPWENRAHFFKVAAIVLRNILVEHARRRASAPCVTSEPSVLDALTDEYDQRARGLPALDESLERLRRNDPLKVEIVELRFFGGRSLAEIGELLGLSARTVEREWAAARAWLREDVRRA